MGKGLNTYEASDGRRYTQSQVERKITTAKGMKLEQMRFEHGFVFCEECGRSGGTYLDCSHDISVKKAKESGRVELCWSIDNITIRCRECHAEYDKNNVQLNFKRK